ncbi:MAG TPA: c-type cytochrome [Acidobacteriaceae bacterium]|nr:c-type cytochrome [Acidobacteriaceae bacterium]
MRLRTIYLTTALCLGAPALLLAQPPAGGPPPGGPGRGGRPQPKPQNLKVLPDNADLRTIMRGFEQSLGVECEFCHVKAAPGTRPDRASDANPMKDTARSMIRMTDDLNEKYLAQLQIPNRQPSDAAPHVTCGTCHRGEKQPPAFVPPPRNGPAGMTPGAGGPAPAPHPGI